MTMTNTLRRLISPRTSFVALSTVALIVAAARSGLPTLQAQTNPIVSENMLAGSPQSEWDIVGSGDPTIQGFATDISVNKGSIVNFKIKLDPNASDYIIDIYRLGYYQGDGARKVASVVPTGWKVAWRARFEKKRRTLPTTAGRTPLA